MKKSVLLLKILHLRRRTYFRFFETFGDDYAWNIAKSITSSKTQLV